MNKKYEYKFKEQKCCSKINNKNKFFKLDNK